MPINQHTVSSVAAFKAHYLLLLVAFAQQCRTTCKQHLRIADCHVTPRSPIAATAAAAAHQCHPTAAAKQASPINALYVVAMLAREHPHHITTNIVLTAYAAAGAAAAACF
jgi:hypothetical protein